MFLESDSNKMEVRDFHEVAVIPEWVYDYAARRGYVGELLLTKCVMDERMSTDDIATIFYLNRRFGSSADGLPRLNTLNVDYINIEQAVATFDENMKTKIENAATWSYSDRIEQEVNSRLSAVFNETSPTTYAFVVSGPKIWLIVKPGFLITMKDSSKRLDFYRDYLETVGKVSSQQSVVHTDVFANYVEELVG